MARLLVKLLVVDEPKIVTCMPLDYDYLMSLPAIQVEHRHMARDTILHALGIGAGLTAAEDAGDLRFIFEPDALGNGKFGIIVNAVAPGIVDAPAIQALAHHQSVRESARRQRQFNLSDLWTM